MIPPINLTNEELIQQYRTAKSQAFVSRSHRERFEELKYEMNRRGLPQ